MIKEKYQKENFSKIVSNSLSIAEVTRKLGIRPTGGNYRHVKHYIVKYELDTSHFTGIGWNKGLKFKPNPPKPLKEILVKNSKQRSSSRLKNRLLKEGLLQNTCAICNLKPEWNGQSLVLQMDHINGDHCDNRLENLRILCPNCHSQTKTYSSHKRS